MQGNRPMNASEIMKRIFGDGDLYDGFSSDGLKEDLQGWGGHDFLLKVAQELKPRTIIEVGVWKGRSAIAMAKKLKEHDSDFSIICIDTWLGAQEHFQEQFRADMNRKNGYPQLYRQFIHNVISQGQQDVIMPLPLSSLAAAQLLAKLKIQADLIHIDAGHGYHEVKSDIAAFWPLLKSDGVMIFDDYGGWQGVTKAVNEFAAENALPLIGTHGKALISNSRNYRFRASLTKIEPGAWVPKPG